jgi:hypothetical protein
MLTFIFFGMIITQSAAYLWFQSKGGVVSHKSYMAANACFMLGQTAQAADSFTKGAWASFSIAAFYFVMTAIGIFKRYALMRQDSGAIR